MPNPEQIYVPVLARGPEVIDNGGDVIIRCLTPRMAVKVAQLINDDAYNGNSR